jgi:plastocyanin
VHAKDTDKFDRTQYTATAGSMTIGYVDDGQLVHTLLIEGQSGFRLSVASNQRSTSGTVTLAPGAYTIFCDVPGHREEGMVAQLTVR